MAERLPDWLVPQAEKRSSASLAERHLKVLRDLLRRDHVTRPDWQATLRGFALMARDALQADRTLVALCDRASGRWTAVTSEGDRLEHEAISEQGSRTALESVRASARPILTAELTALPLQSESLELQQVGSILAVPLLFLDRSGCAPSERHVGGCLYAHRTRTRPPFTQDDVELVLDIASIAQPNLNLLSYLEDVESSLEQSRAELRELRQEVAERWSLGQYETREPSFAREILAPLRRAARADRVNLMILGPSGSGKSHLAQAFHYESARRGKPFVTLDCSQITSSETLAAELFGYAPSSGYANAPPKGRPGKAKLASGGTLFIDEIGCLPPELQPRLLRLLQTGLHSPLGSSDEVHADLQIVSATNEELQRLVHERRFREDLYWRLQEMCVRLPPLSRRPADIPVLAEGFLRKAAERYGRTDIEGFTSGALRVLVTHDWSMSGNIRGLEHALNRSVLMAPEDARRLDDTHLALDTAGHLRLDPAAPAPPSPDTPHHQAASGATAPHDAPSGPLPPRPPSSRTAELRSWLEQRLALHQGKLRAMARDPEVARAFGYSSHTMPESTLSLRMQELDLRPSRPGPHRPGHGSVPLSEVVAALRAHRKADEAARALGLTRDALVWRLRREGLTVRQVLRSASPDA